MKKDSGKQKLLIVDDDEDLRTQMKWALAQDYEVLLAEDRPSAAAVMRKEQPAVVTLDLGLPPLPAGVEEGFAVLDEILNEYGQTKVIIITGRGEKENALRAVEKGAYDFFYKPIQLDELKVVLRRAFHLSQLEREQRALQQRLSGDTFEGMLGNLRKDAGGLHRHPEGGDHGRPCPDHGGKRHRQGACGPRHAPAKCPSSQILSS